MKIPLGRTEKVFLCLLAAYFVLSLLPTPAILTFLVGLATIVLAGWVFVRLSSHVVRKLLWRLRNRLIVAYVFIALVPIVLITLLVLMGASALGGQLAIYLLNSEMDRRTSSLRASIEYLARNAPDTPNWAGDVGPYLQGRYPGLQMVFEGRGDARVFPLGAAMTPPPAGQQPGNGLVVVKDPKRGEVVYGYAHAVARDRSVTAMFPITRDYLGEMAPDLCESAIINMRTMQVLLHPPLSDAPSRNRVPPPVNRLDFEIVWGAPIPLQHWGDVAAADNRWLTVRTRVSAVLRTVFEQKVELASDLYTIVFFTVAIAFLIAEVIALIIGMSITRTITRAVHNLYEWNLRVRAGDFSHRIPIRGHDQLGDLAVAFNEMTENMERLLVVEKERERLQAELEIAREVQNQLYPRSTPEVETLALKAACNPARMVSGDYYDYQQMGHEKVAIAIGDVAGKGISAALLMATVQSSFRSQIRNSLELAVGRGNVGTRITVSTSTLVSHLNKQLYADTSPEKYATFYLGVYDVPSATLTYTNAGHLPPILVRNGEAERLEVNGMVVGAFPFAVYGESQIKLQTGDLVVFFTDGISEPEDAYGEQFGEDRLVDMLVKYAHLTETEIIDRIMDAVRQWTGSDELQDDMTLLLMRRR